MVERRQRRLCFNCDERFVPGHRCKLPFQCLIVEDTNDNKNEGEMEVTRQEDTIKPAEEEPNISFHALQGNGSPHTTLRFLGRIVNHEVHILVVVVPLITLYTVVLQSLQVCLSNRQNILEFELAMVSD